MRIGILTFHSQLNYGGVLQAYALQQALMRMGHEVQVIDRWLTPDNRHLEGGYNYYRIRQWIHFCLRVLMGGGDISIWLRHQRTKRFIHTQLNLTHYHFYNWSEIRSARDARAQSGEGCAREVTSTTDAVHFNLDAIVVGSDQVWHCGNFNDPRPYLLEGFPDRRPILLSYAASFGFKAIPKYLGQGDSPIAKIESEPVYRRGLARFSAISCRESEGVQICRDLGFAAAHVVDPTLLLPREAWSVLGQYKKHPKHVVCYLLGVDIASQLPILTNWAKRTNRHVTILCDGGVLKPFPKSLRQILSRVGDILCAPFAAGPVRQAVSFGPREFYRAFAEADKCITDSFHAVMFSYICNCNARFLRPTAAERKDMFARIEEFAASCIRGTFISDGLPAALASLDGDPLIEFDEGAISSHRNFSRDWLEKSLEVGVGNRVRK